jgi:UDP-N-acetylglucosamine/UDP-N-acetylgalactosamine diphosphorylase
MSTDATTLRDAWEQAGQGHVFRFWDELSEAERLSLLEQAREIDLLEIGHLTGSLVQGHAAAVDLSHLDPAPHIALPEHGGDAAAWAGARLAGEEALRAGRVGAFTVAGGQGTRLGFDGPKGTFPATPVTKKPIFQVFAEKIRAAELRYRCRIPWCIMTSHINQEATVSFFEQHRFFGLSPGQVRFFRQGRMPAVDEGGRILLEGKAAIALSPDGHGGSLRALVRSGALDALERDGIDVLSYFQVDNPLVRCVDPAFIGHHLLGGSEMSSKMVPKAHSKEKVGNFCLQDGKLVVIEYSDLPDDLAEKRREDGSLTFLAGSIGIHLLSTAFIRRVGGGAAGAVMPFHKARKKIPTLDEAGQPVKPDRPNGVKFEMFVFDAIPFARSPLVVETRREDEFSPIKNAEGPDSARTCRDDQVRQFARWLRAAGVDLPTDPSGLPGFAIEVSPLFGDDEDAFSASWRALETKPDLGEGLAAVTLEPAGVVVALASPPPGR